MIPLIAPCRSPNTDQISKESSENDFPLHHFSLMAHGNAASVGSFFQVTDCEVLTLFGKEFWLQCSLNIYLWLLS